MRAQWVTMDVTDYEKAADGAGFLGVESMYCDLGSPEKSYTLTKGAKPA